MAAERGLFTIRRAGAAVGGAAALAAAVSLAPWPTGRVVTADGSHEWPASSAPLRRSVVWQPAESVDERLAGADLADSLITPQIADHGRTLYLTRRSPGGRAHIWRAHRTDSGGWTAPEPVEELNSDADDVGPAITRDGRELYLFSNRDGGLGGFDLYVCMRLPDGRWSPPRNLGPKVNGPADEYDPAPAPDGRTLYFASSRDNPAGPAPEWTTTLRAHLDRVAAARFDLFSATRETPADGWSAPEPLSAINRPDAHTGAPHVSPDGAFLYFASDRPVRSGEARNLDLFRARIRPDGTVGGPENLGPGVNTAANETEPALSDEGFTLLFSRNAEAAVYTVLRSRSAEVFDQTAWEAGPGWALLMPFADIWWQVLLIAGAFAALAAVFWWLRRWLFEKATASRFAVASLLVHLLILLSVWTVPVAERVVERIAEIAPVEAVFSSDAVAGGPTAGSTESTFARTADLAPAEPAAAPTVERTDLPPSDPTAPPLPDTDVPMSPSARATAVLPAATASYAPQLRTTEAPVLQRAARSLPTPDASGPLDAAAPAAQAAPAEQGVEARATTTARSDPAAPDATLRPAAAAADAPRPTAAPVTVGPAEAPPAAMIAGPAPPSPARPVTAAPVATVEIETAAPAPVAAAVLGEAPIARADVARADVALNAPAPTGPAPAAEPAPPAALRPSASPAQVRAASAEPAVAAGRASLSRNAPKAAAPASAGADEIAPAPAAETRAETALSAAAAGVERRAEGAAPTNVALTSGPAAEVRPTAGRPAGVTAVEAAPTVASATSAPARSRPAASVPTEIVEPVAPPAPGAAAKPAESDLLGVAVQAERRPTDSGAVTPTPSGPQPGGLGAASPTAARAVDVAPTATTSAPSVARTIRRPLAAAAAEVETPAVADRPVASGIADPSAPAAAVALGRSVPDAPDTARPAAAPAGSPTVAPTIAAVRPTAVAERGPTVAGSTARLPVARVRTGPAAVADEIPDAEPAPVAIGKPPAEPAVPGAAVAAAKSAVAPARTDIGPAGQPARTDLPARAGVVRIGPAEGGAPEIAAVTGRPARRTAKVGPAETVEDAGALEAAFALRQPEVRKAVVEREGGNAASEAAVERGLQWLAGRQNADGSWSLHRGYPNASSLRCDAGATGLALLPLLGAGHTHQAGKHQAVVARGVKWLLSRQQLNGDLHGDGPEKAHMYSQAIAAIALCEAYGMTRDPALKDPAQRALDFIVAAQSPQLGGWRYSPGRDSDTSVLGWQVQALRSGELAGLAVPAKSWEGVRRWLASVEAAPGRFGYTGPQPTTAMTAQGLLCLQLMGSKRDDKRLAAGAEWLATTRPTKGGDTSYGWYYATQVLYHRRGAAWERWNPAMRDLLVETQLAGGAEAGSWTPADARERTGGRLYATSLRLLTLEVYYRHLPLYRQLEE